MRMPLSNPKSLLLLDLTLVAGIICSLGSARLHADITMITAYVLLYPYLLLTQRRQTARQLVVASLYACFYFYCAKTEYKYNREMLLVGGYTIYPLFAWALGLFAAVLVFSNLTAAFPAQTLASRLTLFAIMYWIFLLSFETAAYHLFNFRDMATAGYPGLPILDCIHAPGWMKAVYLLNGPLYFLLCESIAPAAAFLDELPTPALSLLQD